MLSRLAAAKVTTTDQNAAVLKSFLIERVIGILLTIILESVLADPVESDTPQKAGGNDSIRIDIVEKQRDARTGNCFNFIHRFVLCRVRLDAPEI